MDIKNWYKKLVLKKIITQKTNSLFYILVLLITNK